MRQPARAAGGTRYVHLACTRYLTCLHTGDRSADAIKAGQALPGYGAVIVRDGYIGYEHPTARCMPGAERIMPRPGLCRDCG